MTRDDKSRVLRYEAGCTCQDWCGKCEHCLAKDVLATPVECIHPGMMLRHPNGMVRDVGDGEDVARAVAGWHAAWREKL